ncbi:hypothetical protein [Flavobacterium frigidarium]|uniref:hypothetical protein n=1 Tax=Flavobacterium frigidarium TaxID=99286 RepID=UPI00040F00DA|nr:hypothetical protein [Flavobacterium frigidarium]
MEDNCFVIMAISDQKYDDLEISADQLKDDYENVIKPAILSARSKMNIVRADECAVPGTITTDILTHLMYDTFVIADVTFPNPNVFYELGLRHSFKPGTILIKNSSVKIKTPFDISHQRYIEYECTPKGIQDLAKQLREFFNWYDKNPLKPDNQVLHLAQLIKFEFPKYAQPKQEVQTDLMVNMFSLLAANPEMLPLITDNSLGDMEKGMMALQLFKDQPDAIKTLIQLGQQNNNE